MKKKIRFIWIVKWDETVWSVQLADTLEKSNLGGTCIFDVSSEYLATERIISYVNSPLNSHFSYVVLER
jgi:hypothetical protein